jgi:hypothetical protein
MLAGCIGDLQGLQNQLFGLLYVPPPVQPRHRPALKDGPEDIACAEPADRIFRALAEALGKPAPAPSQ